jgi:hypothetical protein
MQNDLTQHFRESNLIENIDDPDSDEQVASAWEYLSKQDKLTMSNVCKTQKIITLLQDDLAPNQRGYTRSMSKVNVYIGDYVPPTWAMVDDLLNNWLLDMDEFWATLDPRDMHLRFEGIHPFVDGNGRTGRMLMWWHYEVKLGKKPLILNATKYNDYYPLFEKYQRRHK